MLQFAVSLLTEACWIYTNLAFPPASAQKLIQYGEKLSNVCQTAQNLFFKI